MSDQSHIISDTLLDALAHLAEAETMRRHRLETRPRADISAFDGFEIMFDGSEGGVVHLDDDISPAADLLDAPVWPMNISSAVRTTDSHPSLPSGGWLFKSVRTLDPRKWRGRLARVTPRMVEHSEIFVSQSGVGASYFGPYALARDTATRAEADNHPGGGISVHPHSIYGARSHAPSKHIDWDIRVAHYLSLRREYLWSVLIGEGELPRVRYVTDIVGVREAFRFRDIPEGKKRRAALRHWVRDHWRQFGRESGADRQWIREHLRGAEDFAWSGFRCRIEPSREDARWNNWTRAKDRRRVA